MVTNAAEKTSEQSENDMETISFDSKRIQKLNLVVDSICHCFPLLDDLTSPLSISEQLLSQLMVTRFRFGINFQKSEFQFGLYHSLIRLIQASSLKYSNGVYKLETSQLIPNSIYKVLPSFVFKYLQEILGEDSQELCLETLRKLFLQIPDLFSRLLHVIRDNIPGKGLRKLSELTM